MGFKGPPELTQGAWAGDRFDVVTLDKVENTEGWEDVSDQLVEEYVRVSAADGLDEFG
jgi:hypothetical protein